jgi:hypothetical protein
MKIRNLDFAAMENELVEENAKENQVSHEEAKKMM